MKFIKNLIENIDTIMYVSGIVFFITGVIYILIELIIDFFMLAMYSRLL